MQQIELAWKVKDKITGIEGIVNHIVFYAGAGPMAGVARTALDKDGKPHDNEMYDFTQLEVIDKNPLFDVPEKQEFKFSFGDKVKDTITGYEGKVAGLAHYINGCNRIQVQAPYDKTVKDGKRLGEFFAEAVLELVTPAKPEEKAKVATTSRGGPADFDSSFP